MSDVKANAAVADAALQASALTRKFGDLTAVDHVTLTIKAAEHAGHPSSSSQVRAAEIPRSHCATVLEWT
jgi:hypothetical protein